MLITCFSIIFSSIPHLLGSTASGFTNLPWHLFSSILKFQCKAFLCAFIWNKKNESEAWYRPRKRLRPKKSVIIQAGSHKGPIEGMGRWKEKKQGIHSTGAGENRPREVISVRKSVINSSSIQMSTCIQWGVEMVGHGSRRVQVGVIFNARL